MRKALVLLFLLVGACGGRADTVLHSDEASYRFPASHIRSETGDGHRFVRVHPPDSSFDLVYDSRITGRKDKEDWPQVFSLNDEGKPNIDRHIVGDLKVVCRRAVNPRSGCGIEILHRGIVWNAVFPRKYKLDAKTIEREALELLDSYSA